MLRSSLLRGTAAYSLAAAVPRVLGLLLLPFYTRVLTPTEYGQIAIVATLGLLVQALSSFGLETAFFREFSRNLDRTGDRSRITNTFGLFALGGPPVISLAMGLLLAAWLAGPLAVSATAVVIASVTGGLQTSALIFPLAKMRSEQRLGSFVLTTQVAAITSAVLTVVAVIWLDLGVIGWFAASLIGAVVLVAFGISQLQHSWTRHVDRAPLLVALAFGVPLLPHFVSHWALNVSDRLILAAFVDQSSVGVYGLAQQFALPASIIVVAISQALMPRYVAGSVAGNNVNLRQLMTDQALVVVFCCFAVALLAPAAILLLAPPDFSGAADLVGWIVLGFLLFGLYLGPMNVVSLVAGRTRWIWVITLVAATTNVGLNLWLVPTYGAMAAAVDTAAGYAVLLVGIHLYLWTALDRPARYDWQPLSIAMIGMAAHMASPPSYFPQQVRCRRS